MKTPERFNEELQATLERYMNEPSPFAGLLLVREHMRRIGRKGALATNRKLSAAQRRKNAKRAARARWAAAKPKRRKRI